MMDLMAMPVALCRHCGYEIERNADGDWVDVRFTADQEPDYCAMGPYGSHFPEQVELAN